MISADVMINEATGEPYYALTIDIGEPLGDELKPLELTPGVPVEVFLLTEDRSPLNYLAKPLTDYLAKAFREK